MITTDTAHKEFSHCRKRTKFATDEIASKAADLEDDLRMLAKIGDDPAMTRTRAAIRDSVDEFAEMYAASKSAG